MDLDLWLINEIRKLLLIFIAIKLVQDKCVISLISAYVSQDRIREIMEEPIKRLV